MSGEIFKAKNAHVSIFLFLFLFFRNCKCRSHSAVDHLFIFNSVFNRRGPNSPKGVYNHVFVAIAKAHQHVLKTITPLRCHTKHSVVLTRSTAKHAVVLIPQYKTHYCTNATSHNLPSLTYTLRLYTNTKLLLMLTLCHATVHVF